MNISFQLKTVKASISVSNSDSSNTLLVDWLEPSSRPLTKKPDSITFETLKDRRPCSIYFRTAVSIEPIPSGAEKIAYASFSIGPEGVYFSGNGEPIHLDLPSGEYRLIFHAIPGGESDIYEFIFVSKTEYTDVFTE